MRIGVGLAMAAAVLPCAPLAAQDDAEPVTAEEAVEIARELYAVEDVAKPDEGCGTPLPGEILVCRRIDDPDRYRVRSSSGLAADAGVAPDDGLPRAPDLYGGMTGGVTVARGCFIPPCPPPAALMIDLDALPEPPPGSDAARYGYVPPEAEAEEQESGPPSPQAIP